MRVLVEYRCPACGRRTEHWVGRPVPDHAPCGGCGASAARRFGGALVGRGSRSPAPAAPGGGCVPDLPGSCVLAPTAARMLVARARGDNRAIDREAAHQERAIAAGTLDPTRGPVAPFAGATPS